MTILTDQIISSTAPTLITADAYGNQTYLSTVNKVETYTVAGPSRINSINLTVELYQLFDINILYFSDAVSEVLASTGSSITINMNSTSPLLAGYSGTSYTCNLNLTYPSNTDPGIVGITSTAVAITKLDGSTFVSGQTVAWAPFCIAFRN